MRWASGIPLVFLLCMLWEGTCQAKDRELTLAVWTEEPAASIAENIRELFDERGLQFSIQAMSDPGVILLAVRERRIDLAIVEEPDSPVSGLVTLVSLYPSVLHVLYKRDQRVDDFPNLVRGASIYAGPKGGVSYRLLMQLAEDFRVPYEQFSVLENPWTETPDVYFIFGGLLDGDSIERLAGYQLFSFAQEGDVDGGSVADAVVLRHSYLKKFLLPRSVYYSLAGEAIVTLSIRSVLIAHEQFDEDLAMEMSSQLFNGAQEIAQGYSLVTRELNTSIDASALNFPLHSGTRRFLDRDKPGFIERNVDVLALSLTVLAAILSGLLAWYRNRQQLKKDRFDAYYQRLLEIRQNYDTALDSTELRGQRQAVLDLQREVLGLLVDERIAADNNLTAFLSLSNQVLNEINASISS